MPVHINQGAAQAANQDFAKAVGTLNEFLQGLVKQLEQDRADAAQQQSKMIDIKMGRNIVYRGIPGEEPLINKLSPDKVKLLRSAIAQSNMPSQKSWAEDSPKPDKGVIDIKTYDSDQRDQTEKTVFRRVGGKNEINLFAPEANNLENKLDKPEAQLEAGVKGSVHSEPLQSHGLNINVESGDEEMFAKRLEELLEHPPGGDSIPNASQVLYLSETVGIEKSDQRCLDFSKELIAKGIKPPSEKEVAQLTDSPNVDALSNLEAMAARQKTAVMPVEKTQEPNQQVTNNQPPELVAGSSRFDDLDPETLARAKQNVIEKAGKAYESEGTQSRSYQTYSESAKRFEQIQHKKGLLPDNVVSADIGERIAQQIKEVVAQNQAAQGGSQNLQILPVIVVVQREIEKIKDGPAKDWVKGTLDSIKGRAVETAKNLPEQVMSLPQRIKDRQIAATASQILAHYGERKDQGIACQTEKYQISAQSKGKFSIQDHQGKELMRFEQGMLGPKVLENNLTKREEKEILQVHSQIHTHGGTDKISEDPSMRLRQLGGLAPLGDLQAARQFTNHECFEAASKVAQYLGRDRGDGVSEFKGDKYVVQQLGDQLKVSARDGRGEILSNRDGQVQGSLTSRDVASLRNIALKIDRDISQKQSPSQPSQQDARQIVPGTEKEKKLAGVGLER